MQVTFTESREFSWSRFFVHVGYIVSHALLGVLLLVALASYMSPPPQGQTPFLNPPPQEESACEEQGGVWVPDINVESENKENSIGYCSGPFRAEREWNEQSEQHDKTVRQILVAGGAVAALIALLLSHWRFLAISLFLTAILAFYTSSGLELPSVPITDQAHVILLGLAWTILAYGGRMLSPQR